MRNLYAYQKEIIDTIAPLRSAALFMEQGTGKTQVILSEVMNDREIDGLVVVGAPNGLQYVWQQEIQKNDIDAHVIRWAGSRNKSIERDIEYIQKTNKLTIILCNIDIFKYKESKGQQVLHACMHYLNSIHMVIDQSSCIKNPAAKCTKYTTAFANLYASKIKKRRILEGDACSGGFHELYSQCMFLDKRILECPSYTAFKHQYCTIGYFNEISSYKNIDMLMKKIAPYSVWKKRDECFDLPECVDAWHTFDLNVQEETAIDLVQKGEHPFCSMDGMEDIPSCTNDIMHHLTMLLYSQQICSGVLSLRGMPQVPSSKVSHCKEIITVELKKRPFVVFCNYHFEIDLICAMLESSSISWGVYYGDNVSTRYEDLDHFVNGDIQCLVGTQASLGKGFTLTNCCDVVFYSKHASYRLLQESIKRVYRNTQTKKVVVHHLCSTHHIEQDIHACLQRKENMWELAQRLAQSKGGVKNDMGE